MASTSLENMDVADQHILSLSVCVCMVCAVTDRPHDNKDNNNNNSAHTRAIEPLTSAR